MISLMKNVFKIVESGSFTSSTRPLSSAIGQTGFRPGLAELCFALRNWEELGGTEVRTI